MGGSSMESVYGELSRPYNLTPEQVADYRREGHIYLADVASRDVIGSIRPHLLSIIEEVVARQDAQGRTENYSSFFTQVSNVWRLNRDISEFILAERFGRIAAELMGVDGVRIYHDQALIKEPGGKPTPWHQDQYYWPLDTAHTITMWMPLVDVTTEMGSMSFAAGSHLENLLKDKPISEDSDAYFEGLIGSKKYAVKTYQLKAGDATFHSGSTIHSAHGNSSKRRREVITIIYYADGTRILEPDNEHRKVDMEVFHPGQKPGEIAASELNPLVYKNG
jgi:ectoine hydroxylase-related dioxygenase (phytanoyl-CoA dioxygenase family)